MYVCFIVNPNKNLMSRLTLKNQTLALKSCAISITLPSLHSEHPNGASQIMSPAAVQFSGPVSICPIFAFWDTSDFHVRFPESIHRSL